ncbi:MAG: methyltransferase domain-containing protein [Magnetococcales bacterium]|nr:methyltransferase domain-containing protein [Magnetococcales bacterium]
MRETAILTEQAKAEDKLYKEYSEEAKFGMKYVEPFLLNLNDCSHVLEVGSGPCILISQLSMLHKNINFQAIEPMGPGFYMFDSLIQKAQKDNLFKLYPSGYETFESEIKFDLIYLINSFEHLPDFQHCIHFLKDNLAANGRCIILCPNYSFPYEPHFQLPVIISSKITHYIFRKKLQLLRVTTTYTVYGTV